MVLGHRMCRKIALEKCGGEREGSAHTPPNPSPHIPPMARQNVGRSRAIALGDTTSPRKIAEGRQNCPLIDVSWPILIEKNHNVRNSDRDEGSLYKLDVMRAASTNSREASTN